MKLKDNSESLRIRADLAIRVRAEAERLNLSFLQTVYFILLTYFSQQASQAKEGSSKTMVIESKTTSNTVDSKDDDEEGYVFDMLD